VVGERKYLHTFADLVDRLSIVLLKSIYIREQREAYRVEMALIKHDIHLLGFDAELLYDTLVLMLANRVIWENESKARAGGSEQDKLLKFTHSINGVRNQAKNRIAVANGQRLDKKVDCLAADLPPEFGDWAHVFD
jgi:hypothetical protein